ncbi:MAG: ATP-dependent zinc metalloprotease FtsH [Bacteroidales bacterium]|nr:ATP-dependent zinc metalloprotease FtsH [Bacteroidales bacterium]
MKENKRKVKVKFNIYWIYLIIIIGFIFLQFYSFTPKPKEINIGPLKEMIRNGEIQKIVIVNKEIAEIYLKKEVFEKKKLKDEGYIITKPQFYHTILSPDGFYQDVNKILEETNNKDLQIINETRKDYWGDILSWVIPIALLFLLWVYIMRKMAAGGGNQIFNVGKSRAKLFDKESRIKVNFNDVAGLEEAKIELQEIVDFLKNPKKYSELGGKIPKGALLIGPPGTGKTLLAKAIAGEANVPFFSISGSEFVELFVGVGASRVRDLFQQAKEKAPCIVFIDEIDAVGRARGKNPGWGANDERENTLNQLLTEMDGFDSSSGVIILAATNRPDILDRALVRSGRFDRQIHIELPDLKEREEIFKVHLRPIKYDKSIDLSFLAKQTPGFSGADIANVCNEAALIAARKNKKVVEKQDFLDAIDRIVAGLERKNKVITLREKKIIAYHEAGHAVVSWFLEYANPLVKVTIIPRGKSLGAAWYLPEERQISTKEQILDEICATLGGRASEEIIFNKVSTGALNDLERVTKQAYALVAYYGMSNNLNNISYYDSSSQYEVYFSKPYSEKTAELIDKEVKEIIDTQYERAKNILIEHREELDKLSSLLLEKEVIFSEDIEKILGKRPFSSYHEEIEEEKRKRQENKETNKNEEE